MSMNMKVDCPHCSAVKHELCKDNCTVNGEYIVFLKETMKKLGLHTNMIIIRDGKEYLS